MADLDEDTNNDDAKDKPIDSSNNIVDSKNAPYLVSIDRSDNLETVSRLEPICENTFSSSSNSSIQTGNNKTSTVQLVNMDNVERKMTEEPVSLQLHHENSSSSGSSAMYKSNDLQQELYKRNNVREALNALKEKIQSSDLSRISVLQKDALPNGIDSLKTMFNVTANNPMILGKLGFWNETGHLITDVCSYRPTYPKEAFTQLMIIGMGYTKSLRDQWYSFQYPIKTAYVSHDPVVASVVPDLDTMTVFDYVQNRSILPSNVVKRDFLRSLCSEYVAQPCTVYSVNNLGDQIRAPTILSDFELNLNVNRLNFIKYMRDCNWKIDKICFDNYRMIPAYIADNFGRNFFDNIKKMAELNILGDYVEENGLNHGTIYLPFNDHFFYHVHVNRMYTHFNLSYLTYHDIGPNNNTRHYATESETLINLADLYNVRLEQDHNQHITATERQLLDYNTNLGITQEEMQSIIDLIEVDITHIRYIVLRKKYNSCPD